MATKLSAYEEELVQTVCGAYSVTRGTAIANLFPDKASDQDRRELADQIAKWKAR